jgi:AcrR family transcriptional regulator
MSRPKKTDAQLQTMRERILDIAYAILEEGGPEAISSRAIAERMGIAHMSLFTYFDNQAAIMGSLRERELSKWRTQRRTLEQRAQSEDITIVVREMLKSSVDLACEKPNLYRLAWVTPEMSGESIEQTRLRMQDTVESMAGLLRLGMKQGVFTKREPRIAAITALGIVNMPHVLFHSGKMADPATRDRVADEVFLAAMLYLGIEESLDGKTSE